MQSLQQNLVMDDARLMLLLTPPFDKSAQDPGYIKGYLPGVRENGAQYTHAALWVVLATALRGDGARAVELLQMINPLSRTQDPDGTDTYKVEPYVIVADIYSMPQHLGRGGWTWYTGSASWFYRVALETILGFTRAGATLRMDPCIPPAWDGYRVRYRFGSATYVIEVKNPSHVSRGVASVTVDDAPAPDGGISLLDDGGTHAVIVILGDA
jgi:cyclic beta-1,2-glucan synthetase